MSDVSPESAFHASNLGHQANPMINLHRGAIELSGYIMMHRVAIEEKHKLPCFGVFLRKLHAFSFFRPCNLSNPIPLEQLHFALSLFSAEPWRPVRRHVTFQKGLAWRNWYSSSYVSVTPVFLPLSTYALFLRMSESFV